MSVATTAGTPLAVCRQVSVVYGAGDARVTALRDVDLAIQAGDTVALWGTSGSGKTTLLHVLGGLIAPSRGEVRWHGEPLSTLDAAARGRARAAGIAYVFQGSNLLPYFTAEENVAFAAHRAEGSADPSFTPAELLGLVGLSRKREALPAELSGGERQRVAIARAVAQRAELLLCDEPTGQLDSDTGTRVLDMIDALWDELGFALAIATHDVDVAARAQRVVCLAEGRVTTEEAQR
jgi:putative ABC transport system ATP-binding protein